MFKLLSISHSLSLYHLIMSVLFRAYKYAIKLAHAVVPPPEALASYTPGPVTASKAKAVAAFRVCVHEKVIKM